MPLASFLMLVLEILSWIIIADAVLSWFQRDATQFPRSITTQITDPLYAPVRALVRPDKIGIDLSPLILLFLLEAMKRMLASTAY